MEITKPSLPPKAGYVEVEIDGRRTYRNVATGVLIEDEARSSGMTGTITDEEAAAAIREGVDSV